MHNPWIANDRVADCRTIATMADTFDNSYTPDGVVTPTTTEERVINEFNNFRRRLYHWGAQPPDNRNTGAADERVRLDALRQPGGDELERS